jgi:hypothetical protein
VPSNSPSTSNTVSPQPTASTSSPSLIICAWIPIHDDETAPELWQLFLTPDERIDRLNIVQQVSELNHDFQWFECVDGKIRLMGYDDGRRGPKATWNIFLDVPIPNGM